MADHDAPKTASEAPLAAEQIAERSFPTSRKGFDPREVRRFLGEVADALRASTEREQALRRLVDEAQEQLRRLQEEAARVAAEPVDETKLASSEAVRILSDAKAETERILSDARAHAATEAENRNDAAATRVLEQEARANRVRKTAQEEAEAIRARARTEGEAVIEAARDRGREMVGEAQAARERILTDLTKRKRAAQAQLDQLYVSSERLLDTLRMARRGIDELSIRFEASAEGVQPGRRVSPGSSPSGPASPVASSPSSGESTGGGSGSGSGGRTAAAGSSGASSSGAGPRPNPTPWQARRPEPPAARPPGPTPAAASVRVPPQGTADVERAGGTSASSHDVLAGARSSIEGSEPQGRTPPADERKSSSLRILRRGRGVSVPPGERPELPTVRPADITEGVRIIGVPRAGRVAQEAAPAPEEVVGAAPEVVGVAPVVAAPEDMPAEVLPSDEVTNPEEQATPLTPPAELREPTDSAEPVQPEVGSSPPEPVPGEAAAEEATAAPAVEEATGAPAAEALVGASAEAVASPEPATETRPRIEELFARIRADREQAVTKATAVLADQADERAPAGPPTSPPPADEPRTPSAPASPRSSLAVLRSGAPAESPRRATPESPRSDADEQLLKQRDQLIDPLAVQLVRRLKRTMQDDQNGALDRLRTARAADRMTAVVGAREEQAAPYADAGSALLDEAARAGSASTPAGAAPVTVDDLALALAREVCDGLRGRLERALEEATREDLDLSGISERLSAIYREMKVDRLDRLAVHHLVAAYSRGAFVSTQEGRPLRWIVDDEAACPDCDDNALAGPTPRGEVFPTGQLHPPVHLGCRCLVVSGPA